MNTPVDLRLAPAAVGTWLVCVVATRTPHGLTGILVAGSAGVLAWAWPRRRARHREAWRGWLSVSIALGCAITVAAGGVASAQVAHRQHIAADLRESHTPDTRILARLTSEPVERSAGYGAHARLLTREGGGHRQAVNIPAHLTGVEGTWTVGDVVAVSGHLSGGDGGLVFVRVSQIHSHERGEGLHAVVQRLREGVRGASASLPPHARGLVPGVSIGDDRRLPEHMASAMRTTSLTHITAVSGAHVAIVLGTLAVLLARAPGWVRLTVTALVLVAMVIVVLPTPSVRRAAGMGMITLAAMMGARPRLALPALFATVTILLGADPWLSTSIGFALSVAATFGILFTAAPLARLLGGGTLARALAVPIAAQAWCAPLLLVFEPMIATYSVPANLLALPALAPATILGLASAVTSLASPAAAHAVAQLATPFTAWIMSVATAFAGLPGAALGWVPGSAGIALLIALLLAAAVAAGAARRRRTWHA